MTGRSVKGVESSEPLWTGRRARQIPLTHGQRVRRALAYAHSDEGRRLAQATYRRRGRRRAYPVSAVFAAFLYHCLGGAEQLLITDVTATLTTLSRSQLLKLGFPMRGSVRYKRVYSGYRAIVREIEWGTFARHDHDLEADPRTGALASCPASCPYIAASLDEFISRLILASIPKAIEMPTTVAIDSTDFESHLHPGLRWIDENGKTRWSFDDESAWGHRTGTDRRPTTKYHGYSMNIMVGAPPVGGAPIPQLALGMAVRPGSRDAPRAALNLVDAFREARGPIHEVLVDRGYTHVSAENFARPMRERGIRVVMDLLQNQQVTRPGPATGTMWCDGHLYPTSMPEGLHHISPPKPHDPPAVKARRHEEFDAREVYRFVAHSRHDDVRSSQRFKGPARAGHVRCPNNPRSMRLGPHVPTTNCTPGQPCGCSLTITLRDSEHERDRQQLPWQSTPWARSYARRSLVEGFFGNVRYNVLNMNRGYLRVRRLAATAFLLALGLVSYNIRHLYQWHIERGMPDPWQVQLEEKPRHHDLDPAGPIRGP